MKISNCLKPKLFPRTINAFKLLNVSTVLELTFSEANTDS